MSVSNPDRVVSKQDLADFYGIIYPYLGGSGGGSSPSTVLTQVLAAGATGVTFSNIPTSGDYVAYFSTSTGINYTAINTATEGQVTLTFEPQSGQVIVRCELREV